MSIKDLYLTNKEIYYKLQLLKGGSEILKSQYRELNIIRNKLNEINKNVAKALESTAVDEVKVQNSILTYQNINETLDKLVTQIDSQVSESYYDKLKSTIEDISGKSLPENLRKLEKELAMAQTILEKCIRRPEIDEIYKIIFTQFMKEISEESYETKSYFERNYKVLKVISTTLSIVLSLDSIFSKYFKDEQKDKVIKMYNEIETLVSAVPVILDISFVGDIKDEDDVPIIATKLNSLVEKLLGEFRKELKLIKREDLEKILDSLEVPN